MKKTNIFRVVSNRNEATNPQFRAFLFDHVMTPENASTATAYRTPFGILTQCLTSLTPEQIVAKMNQEIPGNTIKLLINVIEEVENNTPLTVDDILDAISVRGLANLTEFEKSEKIRLGLV